MKQTWNETVTAYVKETERDATTGRTTTSWTKVTYENCFWGQRKADSRRGEELVDADNFICRIPWTDESTMVKVNDIVFLGELEDEIDDNDDGLELKEANPDKWFEVRSVKENNKLKRTAHIKLEG